MNKYIAEFIGTFFLVLTIGCTGIGASAGVIAPLAIGAALMVMVFAGGHISGAHYNPAVTLGVLIRGKLKSVNVIPYWIAQCVAAAIAAFVVSKILRAGVAVTPIITKNSDPPCLRSFLTFALVYVVLNAATAERYIRQFVLWPGNWDDSHDGSICSWRYLRRCVQPRRRHRHFDIRYIYLEQHLNIPGSRLRWWRRRGHRVQLDQSAGTSDTNRDIRVLALAAWA